MSLFLKEPPNSIVGADQNKTVQNHVDAFAVGPSFMSLHVRVHLRLYNPGTKECLIKSYKYIRDLLLLTIPVLLM